VCARGFNRASVPGPSTSLLDRHRGDTVPSDNSYWFPAKRYGWGWGPPTKWQGWFVLLTWTAALFGGVFLLRHNRHQIASILVFVLLMSIVLTLISYWKGEPPKWRWGEKSQ
jgi:hypothetical protein